MKILIAVGTLREEGCADPIAAVVSFPWPPQTMFRVITVAAFVHPPVAGLMAGAFEVADVQENLDAASHDAAALAAAQLKEHGFAADSYSQEGDPESVIVEHAKSWGADLIVVGECHRSAVERFLAGSVSHSVVKHAPCSVLVIKKVHAQAEAEKTRDREPALVE
jgi:nucleotide-binding universal stress UspA family protein